MHNKNTPSISCRVIWVETWWAVSVKQVRSCTGTIMNHIFYQELDVIDLLYVSYIYICVCFWSGFFFPPSSLCVCRVTQLDKETEHQLPGHRWVSVGHVQVTVWKASGFIFWILHQNQHIAPSFPIVFCSESCLVTVHTKRHFRKWQKS